MPEREEKGATNNHGDGVGFRHVWCQKDQRENAANADRSTYWAILELTGEGWGHFTPQIRLHLPATPNSLAVPIADPRRSV